jgi:hypothetical protein
MMTARNVSRLFSVGLAMTTGTVLGIALWLDPSPLGHSTHLQLGLGTCTFLQLTGFPCPMCGCTTTFALWAHLQPFKAIFNQPFGSMLFLMTLGAFATSIAEIIQPRDRWVRLADRLAPYETHLASLFLAAMTAGWIYKIFMMRMLA